MGSLSDAAENMILDHLCLTSLTATSVIYLALATADPTDTGTGAAMNEVANSAGYARTAITFGAASSRVVTQSGAVTFPQATGTWGSQVSHWGVVNDGSYGAGSMLAHGAFATSKAIVSGQTPSVATAEINVTFSANEWTDYAANGMLNLLFRNQAFSIPATYVGLATNTINDTSPASSIAEVNGGAYARVSVAANGGASPTWDKANGGSTANTSAIAFTTASAAWGTVVSVFISDGSVLDAGNILVYDNGDLVDTVVGTDDTVQFPSGSLDITLT